MNQWELNEEQLKQLGWTTNAAVDTGEMGNIYDRVKTAAGLEAAAARKVRPALPMFGEPVADPDTIFDFSIKPNKVLDIPSNQRLVSVELSRKFQIRPEHIRNAGVAQALAISAAHDQGVAEDAVLLRGQEAKAFLEDLHVDHQNLDRQDKSLLTDDRAIPEDKSVLVSILEAIEKLQGNNQYGDYCAIVAPDLYRRAFQPLQRDTLDAPIHQIRPLLVENGFRYSQAAPAGTGVVISLGGATVNLAVPVDTTVSWEGEENRNIVLSLVERFRLLINEDNAVEQMR